MNNEDLFIKNVADYLNIDLNDFDKKRVLEYLNEYVVSLPKVEDAPVKVITVPKIIYKYVNRKDNHEIVNGKQVKIIEPQKIIELVEKFTKVSEKQMKGKDRYFGTVLARHVSMWFINKVCHETLTETGKMFNRDHTSVINAVKNVTNMAEAENTKYVKLIEQINNELSIPLEQTA